MTVSLKGKNAKSKWISQDPVLWVQREGKENELKYLQISEACRDPERGSKGLELTERDNI